MQVLGIVGSMRKNRNTNALVNRVVCDMKDIDPDVEAELVYVADLAIDPCRVVCSKYCSSNPYQCSLSDDLAKVLDRMVEADALLIGAPLSECSHTLVLDCA